MKILYLAHRIPYPPDKGDKIRAYHHLRHLAAEHDVHLVAFVDQPGEERHAPHLLRMCRRIDLVRLCRRRAILRGAVAMARGRSLSAAYFSTPELRSAVQRAAATSRFDVAWAFSSVMALYFPYSGAARRVVDFVDVDSAKWEQYALASRPPLRWLYAAESRRLRALEHQAGASSDLVLFVTEQEAATYRAFSTSNGNLRVIPNGVDTEYFHPRSDSGLPEPVLLFTGALDYRPNADAVRRVARRILPAVRRKVPQARFIAVGHRPGRALRRLRPPVSVIGSVPDVRPYFEQAAVYVAPMRLGRGLQNKILEAMAMGVPVVTSPLAAQGLQAVPGEHLLLAETDAEFVDAATLLLRDAARRDTLSRNALCLVRDAYRWETVYPLLDEVLRIDPSAS